MRRLAPLGVRLLCYVYITNVVLYILSLALVHNRVLILGRDVNQGISWLVRLALIFIPLYLFIRLSSLKKDGWFLAIYFHIFFIINQSSALLEHNGYLPSLVRIIGIYGSTIYTPPQIFLIRVNILINLVILTHLILQRRSPEIMRRHFQQDHH